MSPTGLAGETAGDSAQIVAVPGAAADAPLPAAGSLHGLRIVVTRPREQSQGLAAAIAAGGGEAIMFPLIDIGEPPDPAALDALIDRLDRYDWAVFASPTAVDRALRRIGARRTLPARWSVAAIGEGTRRALARHGITEVLAPAERFDSEALLALAPLAHLQGRQVVIFRGQEGRAVLGEGLAARGAAVDYAECYTRQPPAGDAGPLLARARAGALDALVITSSEAVRNLAAMLAGAHDAAAVAALRRTPVFVPHPRIAQAASAAGFVDVTGTDGGDTGVLCALVDAAGTGRLERTEGR